MGYLRAVAVIVIAGLIGFHGQAARADEVGVGIIASFTGPFSIWGKEYKEAIDLYLDGIDNKIGSHTIKMYYGDEGGMNPARAKQLAQELVVRDGVAILGGGELTPNTTAVSTIINEAKIPFVIFNSGAVETIGKSPYFVRVAETIWADYYPLGVWAAKEGHYTRCVGIAGDYSPGIEAMSAVKRGFESNGGKIVETIMTPLSTVDFSSYIERIRNDHAQCTFAFIPLGPQSAAFVNAYTGAGLMKAGIQFLGQSETWEPDLPVLGDAALGLITAFPYSPNLDNPTNRRFVAAFAKRYGAEPTDIAMLAFDGMQVIAHMIVATDGKRDGEKAVAAARGFSWDSPQGPVSIDAKTREITQNIYIRKVARVNGKLVNKLIYTFENVKEPWQQLHE